MVTLGTAEDRVKMKKIGPPLAPSRAGKWSGNADGLRGGGRGNLGVSTHKLHLLSSPDV